jgi:hypothetical protein
MVLLKNVRLLTRFAKKARGVNNENGHYHSLVKKIAAQEFSIIHNMNDGSLDRLHLLKTQWYMATNLYLGEIIAGLRPQHLTASENRALIYLGALMAITDMMVDDFKFKTEKISLLLKGEFNDHGQLSVIEHAFIMFHNKLISNINKEKASFIQDFSLRKPQIESKSQLNKVHSETVINEITRRKGGTAVLLTAALLLEITKKNQKAFYQLGAFIQYLNDSQDIYKDAKAGITTFVSYCSSFDEVNQKLSEEFSQTKALFHATDFPEKNIYELLFYIHAMYVGILYKNKDFAIRHGSAINLKEIRNLERKEHMVNIYSLKSFRYCFPKILLFRP